MQVDKIILGNNLSILKTLPNESIDCVVTSPPYWALRNYNTNPIIWGNHNGCDHIWGNDHCMKQTGGSNGLDPKYNENRKHISFNSFCLKCSSWRGSLGLEPTFELYIEHLLLIFDEIKRVLKKEGTCWVNLGDTYSNQKVGNTETRIHKKAVQNNFYKQKQNIAEKCLTQVPSRFAIGMSDRGWILRNEIIWHKPSCMPQSVTDRFTVDFEKVFFFVKNKKYFFNQQKEKTKAKIIEPRMFKEVRQTSNAKYENGFQQRTMTRNQRCVWSINPRGFKDAHFATYPEALIEPMIKAGCPIGGIVLDPFSGAGTTAVVSKKLNRNYLGIELNADYVKISEKRINNVMEELNLVI